MFILFLKHLAQALFFLISFICKTILSLCKSLPKLYKLFHKKNRIRFISIILLAPILYILLFGNIIPRKIPFEKYEAKHDLTRNDLKAVMERESSGRFMVVNVNKRGLIG